jgi:sugar/nucleoside kinase (ribokinase family)
MNETWSPDQDGAARDKRAQRRIMSPSFCDILGLGCIAVDDLLYVATYPAPDTKTRIVRSERQCGGLTATALVAAARLGAQCAYAGTLGDDELSRFAINRLGEEGIDTSLVRGQPGARPIHARVIVDETRQTRTIFYDLEGAQPAREDWPPEEVVRAARALLIDHFGAEGMIRAARLARNAGWPVVADLESDQTPRFAELLGLPDHLIVSSEFACRLTGAPNPSNALDRLWSDTRAAVVVTCGAEGCWYRGSADTSRPVHQPAFAVKTVDTTGCGDVFHGAYAAALVEGQELAERIRFAAATAALKATQRGGQAGIPRRRAVDAFLTDHPSAVEA